MDNAWIPEGDHMGLSISHHPRPDAGSFAPGATPKLVWHTTEGTNLSGAVSTLIGNGDEPHFVVSVDGRQVIQFIALNRTSKSLMHPPGTPETNRAGCIQIEVCGFAGDSPNWTDAKLKRLAALATIIEHRVSVERRTHCRWAAGVTRIPAGDFLHWKGHVGHMHVPNNNHVDPGHMRITRLLGFMGN